MSMNTGVYAQSSHLPFHASEFVAGANGYIINSKTCETNYAAGLDYSTKSTYIILSMRRLARWLVMLAVASFSPGVGGGCDEVSSG